MSEMAIDHAGWGPSVISWFINQYNLHELVRYIYQKPSFFSHFFQATEPYRLGAPSCVKSSIFVPKKTPGAQPRQQTQGFGAGEPRLGAGPPCGGWQRGEQSAGRHGAHQRRLGDPTGPMDLQSGAP